MTTSRGAVRRGALQEARMAALHQALALGHPPVRTAGAAASEEAATNCLLPPLNLPPLGVMGINPETEAKLI